MRGFWGKYKVQRVDNSDEIGGKHYGCNLFVLDITHDPVARVAALAYADATDNDVLASDLRNAVKNARDQAKAEVGG